MLILYLTLSCYNYLFTIVDLNLIWCANFKALPSFSFSILIDRCTFKIPVVQMHLHPLKHAQREKIFIPVAQMHLYPLKHRERFLKMTKRFFYF